MYFCHDQIQTESLKHIGETNKSREEAMMAQLSDSVKHAGGRGVTHKEKKLQARCRNDQNQNVEITDLQKPTMGKLLRKTTLQLLCKRKIL